MRYRITKNSRCLDEKNRLSRNNPILLDDVIKKGHQPAMMLRRVLDWTFTFCNQEDSKGVLLKRSSHVNTSRAGLHAVASFLVVILAGWQLNTCQLWLIDEKTWLSRDTIWPRLAKTREWPSPCENCLWDYLLISGSLCVAALSLSRPRLRSLWTLVTTR